MERLREIFTSLGLAEVKTFIASGNVIFNSETLNAAKLEREIETCLAAALKFDVATFVRSTSELKACVAHEPFAANEQQAGSTLYIGFLRTPPSASAQQIVQLLGGATDEFRFRERELYWLCHTKISDSRVTGAVLEKKLGMPMTLRNSTTVRKIAAAL